jgi:hypothetical protein
LNLAEKVAAVLLPAALQDGHLPLLLLLAVVMATASLSDV